MNHDQSKGAFDQVKGEAKEGFGRVTNNESLETEGKKDKVVGNLQEKFGEAKEKVAEKINEHSDNRKY